MNSTSLRRCALALLTLAAAATAHPDGAAQAALAPSPERARPRLALVLSGGGARGVAHIGALRALEEAGLPIDAIVANSMGSIVGGIYATGRDADQLERIVRSLDWAALFSGRADRRLLQVPARRDRYESVAGLSFDWKTVRLAGGLVAEHRINRFLIENLAAAGYAAGGDFDRLPIPFRAVATDLGNGELVVLGSGDLARAVRASMSIPLVFPPVDWGGRRLVDGLVANNLPVDVGRRLEPQVLVAVDIGSPPLEPGDYQSAFGVASQVNELHTRRRYRDFEADADVLVRPDLGRHSATDYSGFDALIQAGYEATRAALPRIREKLAAAEIGDPAPRSRRPTGPSLDGARIVEVTVRGQERVSERLVRRTFNIPTGVPFAMEKGLRAFDKIEAGTLLDRVWMEFEPVADGVRVVLRVKEAPPNRAEVGLGFSEWERARGFVRLLNRNSFGFGEQIELTAAASDAETFVTGTLRGDRLFVSPVAYRVSGYWLRDKPRFFAADGAELNRGRFVRQGGEAALGAPLKRWAYIEAGLRFGRVVTDEQPGVPAPAASEQVGVAFASAALDNLDDLSWPEHGGRLAARAEWSLAGLGAEREHWSFKAEGRRAQQLSAKLGLQLDGWLGLSGRDLPVYDWYRLGGVTLVPGYRHEELKGAQAFAGALSLRYRLGGKLRLLARAGAGNVFDTRGALGLAGLRWGVGAGAMYPSPLGPVAVELGVNDAGQTLSSLSIGWN